MGLFPLRSLLICLFFVQQLEIFLSNMLVDTHIIEVNLLLLV